jgi:hypothetical protein
VTEPRIDPSASLEPHDDVSLFRNDAPFRWQQRIGLIPRDGGLGVGRRAVFWVAIAWLPIAVWAWLEGRALPQQGRAGEPLLQHFGVHARLLVAIPLLILAEAIAQRIMVRLFPQFVHAGVVGPTDVPRFRAVLRRTARLRDATLPWVIIVVAAVAWSFGGSVTHRAHELLWAAEGPALSLGFGGWWYIYVGRPIFVALLSGWLWRLVILAVTLKWISKLDLVIVPTHPDRAGGLGFVERFPAAFSLVALASAMVIAAGWAHDAKFHGLDVQSLHPMMVAALIVSLFVFLSPYLVFAGPLGHAKKQAILDYGALVARHGTAVRRKWILGDAAVDDPLLSVPEIGPVADTVSMYDAVQRMRPIPLRKTAVFAIALPVLIPFVGVLAIQIPLKQLLGQLVKGLL